MADPKKAKGTTSREVQLAEVGILQRAETESGRPLTVDEVVAGVNLIQRVMQNVMKENLHYGKIPGCGSKPALFKPGSEKILTTFRIAVDPEAEDISGPDEIRYRVRCVGRSATGRIVGVGVGEASTNEEKYHWRKAVCREEFEATTEDRRRKKWKKPYDGSAYEEAQVRTNPSDLANTILKMAKKRAQIDLTLTATAASDVFEQDIEDLPPEVAENLRENRPLTSPDGEEVRRPQRKDPAKTGGSQAEKKTEATTDTKAEADPALISKKDQAAIFTEIAKVMPNAGVEEIQGVVRKILGAHGYERTAEIPVKLFDQIKGEILQAGKDWASDQETKRKS